MEALLARLLRDDASAVALCLQFFDWANDYDHLADCDLPTPEAREDALHRLVNLSYAMQRNAFFQAHRDDLLTCMERAVSAWRIATTLQRGSEPKGHEVAHVLRWTPIDFFLHCARLIGGEQWVQEAGPGFWVEMTRDHSFDEFARECGR